MNVTGHKPLLVFSHGWGFDNRFWEPLNGRLADYQTSCYSRRYFGESQDAELPNRDWVGIGHSFGFRHLTEQNLEQCHGLVSIGGFFDFSVPQGTSQRVLSRMLRQFRQDPGAVLRSFYDNCGATSWNPLGSPDIGRLSEDLEQLGISSNHSLPAVEFGSVPILALAGANDRIVPLGQARTQFVNLVVHEEADHTLGWSHDDWCFSHITAWLRDLGL